MTRKASSVKLEFMKYYDKWRAQQIAQECERSHSNLVFHGLRKIVENFHEEHEEGFQFITKKLENLFEDRGMYLHALEIGSVSENAHWLSAQDGFHVTVIHSNMEELTQAISSREDSECITWVYAELSNPLFLEELISSKEYTTYRSSLSSPSFIIDSDSECSTSSRISLSLRSSQSLPSSLLLSPIQQNSFDFILDFHLFSQLQDLSPEFAANLIYHLLAPKGLYLLVTGAKVGPDPISPTLSRGRGGLTHGLESGLGGGLGGGSSVGRRYFSQEQITVPFLCRGLRLVSLTLTFAHVSRLGSRVWVACYQKI